MVTGKRKGLIGLAAALLLFGGLIFGPAASSAGGDWDNVYDVAITPMTVQDCGRCHTSHFARLKENGARHQQVVCTECHQVFHAYNPMKNNYAELMPRCSSCHDAPHGTAPEVMQCLNCHTDPHQPLASIPDPALLEDRCRKCHADIAAMLTAKPSKHTEQECSSCHSQKHGRIPQCNECHENHSPLAELATADCLACHPVHTPMEISYPLTQAKTVCAGCHEEAFDLLNARTTKHSALTCAKCHPRHGYLPDCRECHGEPHGKAVHQKFTSCGTCHSIAHDVQR
ncbi:MAG: hypothetical protein L3J03_10590 [Desulfobacterales bacterium]|nr:hypothetical protein [Desulfobacterales bacterium]